MTKPLNVTKDRWAGETVAVLASGPSMSQELADSVLSLRRICARRAVRFAPDADMLVTLDGPMDTEFWPEAKDFAGICIIGFESDDVDAMYLAIPHERVTLGVGHVIEVRNNGLAAVRLAAMTGASKIVLLGFDRGHYDARESNVDIGWRGLEEGLDAIIAELRAKGIAVERVESQQE